MYRKSLAGAAALALLLGAPAYAHHPSGVSSTSGVGTQVKADWRLMTGVSVGF